MVKLVVAFIIFSILSINALKIRPHTRNRYRERTDDINSHALLRNVIDFPGDSYNLFMSEKHRHVFV